MKYYFKKFRSGAFLVSFTDYMPPSYRIFDLDRHKAAAFVDHWADGVTVCRMLNRSGAIVF